MLIEAAISILLIGSLKFTALGLALKWKRKY